MGCDSTVKYVDTFFAGTPLIRGLKVDDRPANYINYICPNEGLGSHWIDTEVLGDDNNCMDNWTATGASSIYWNCHEFDFTLQYNPQKSPPYNTVYATATASNVCGNRTQSYIFIPSYWACNYQQWFFKISPNPAQDFINIHLVKFDEESGSEINCQMNNLEIIDFQGNLKSSISVNNTEAIVNLNGYLNGKYVVRTTVEGQQITGQFFVEKP